MPEADRSPATEIRGTLARLDRDREALAKAWLVKLIERASLDEISELPTARIASELPDLIAEVLASAGPGGTPRTADSGGQADRLLRLRDSRASGAGEVTRDVAAIQLVILEALRHDSDELDGAGVAELAAGLAVAAASMQEAVLENVLSRRSRAEEAVAESDALTGLLNQAGLQREAERALALHSRYGHPFALLVLDVDGLRRVNESQGPQAGDRVLVSVALAARRTIRTVDIPARIGGDEFCVLVPDAGAEAARALGERLSEAVRAESSTRDGPGIGVAIGVVACPEHGDEVSTLLDAADAAIYRAKSGGEAVAVGTPAEPEITVKRRT